MRVFDNLGYHNVYLVAAGVAFFCMLALFPAIGALIGLYGLVADPQAIVDQFAAADEFLPPDAYALIREQVVQLLTAETETLSLAFAIAMGIALWSARLGVGALIDGVNITYSEKNERGFFAYYVISLLLTGVLILVVVCAILAIVVFPPMLKAMHVGREAEWLAAAIRWPVVLATVMLGLGVLYRYGPQRTPPRVHWLSWGAAVATALWLLGSLAFSWYVSNFANYNATYGSLGAIVGLMMWFYFSAYAILLGAELNAEMEHQTARDTTIAPQKPMGRRGAYVADHVPGRSPERDEAYKEVENVGDAAEEAEAGRKVLGRGSDGEGDPAEEAEAGRKVLEADQDHEGEAAGPGRPGPGRSLRYR